MSNTSTTRCQQSEIRGTLTNGVHTFFDIPYAKDAGRFQPATAPDVWEGERDATQPGPIFPQLAGRLDLVMGPICQGFDQSEDAFRLNIYTPDIKAKLPVLFWIHGGGFTTGAGVLPCYSGDELARTGRVVVVTLNYRLGLLGNLYLPGVAPGNLSIRDIELALTWVQENIASFGGDPESIVSAGQSAGAWFTQLLASMPATSAKLKGVVILSYPGLSTLAPSLAQDMAEQLCKQEKISHQDLLTLPIDRILELQNAMTMAHAEFAEVTAVFRPVIGNEVPVDTKVGMTQCFAGKPVVIGWTREEMGSFFFKNPAILNATEEQAQQLYRNKLGEQADAYYQQALNRRLDGSAYTAVMDLQTDGFFRQPSLQVAKAMEAAGSQVYCYQFDFQSHDSKVGACHTLELPFLFGNFANWVDAPMLEGIDPAIAGSLFSKFSGYVLNFVESGNPNKNPLPVWPVLGAQQGEGKALHFAEVIECAGVK